MLRKALLAAAASERVRDLVTATAATNAVVSRYVAGESIQDALDVARALRSDGLLVSLDYLGEESTDPQRAAATAAQYVHLLGRLAAEGLSDDGAVEVSVKLTALGLRLGAEGADLPHGGPSPVGERIAAEHAERIAVAARDAGTTVTVDAEDHAAAEATLRIATALRIHFTSAGRGLVVLAVPKESVIFLNGELEQVVVGANDGAAEVGQKLKVFGLRSVFDKG